MALFDGGKAKKAAEEAKKAAEEEARKARMAEAQARFTANKVSQAASQATARAQKAEKELKDMKDAKARENMIARGKVMQARTKPASGIGSGIPSTVLGPLGAQVPKIIASYTVKKGDTLGQIAKNFYGATGPKYWNLIQAANKDLIKDVNVISIGQVFKIPELPLELKKK
jgi:nucleoid-associated protein YgaU